MNDESKQSSGGKARAKLLSPEERSRIAQQGALARWKKPDPLKIPEADYQGELEIGDVALDVYVLKDGRRLIHKRGMARGLGMKSEGGNAFMKTISRKGIGSAISQELWEKIRNPIVFKPLNGDPAHGYEATALIEVCDAVIQARNDEKLAPSQVHLAIKAEIIIRSAAKVGIVALVDEATGYIADKRKSEYRELFQAFIRDELRQWEKEFPDRFFDMIYRLYGLKRRDPKSFKHPGFFGKFIRKYIYAPLANSNGAILEKLEEKNPVVYAKGGRRFKFFQFLTDEIGMPAFKAHIWQVVGIGASVDDKSAFERAFYRAFPEAIPRRKEQQDLFD
jgi:P63C domain